MFPHNISFVKHPIHQTYFFNEYKCIDYLSNINVILHPIHQTYFFNNNNKNIYKVP